ncbi:sigma 54-interacting transcriptional regulator [Fictibacillus sp. KIGAM418]|uniref:Sigma 54-interacting transcriptional regulator n=1 Tax=Fictibacillus marinisediminis TaxID=2878389 RepID=A0A9X1XD11_9BACL|nr:sigma 54-interacting transcriptional regulator [Fictibacillus marinisediminis]MCK6257153.1 sigma 54-interacting transcriptional regulator [Fictibacillus marinisediminis]
MFKDSVETIEMLKAILKTIDEGIHAVDASGMTIFYNEVAARLDGLKVPQVLNQHVLYSFPSLNQQTSTLLNVIKTGKPIINQHQTYTNVNGKRVDTVNTTLPLIVDGELIGAIEISKDLTKIKQLSEKLLDMQAQFHKDRSVTIKNGHYASYHLEDFISADPQIDQLKSLSKKVSETSSPVLIFGETGTGKEVLIQGIHNHSLRKNKPFIAQNCAAIPSQLLESILFGTVKGSFTGAVDRPGLFELADGGTLFLDEINSMPLDIQAKLLRVLQDGVVRRIGAVQGKLVNVRIMAALNEHPSECVKSNKLREDLYYRLNVIFFEIPPLRHRISDIHLLAEHFISQYNVQFKKQIKGLSEEAFHLFQQYPWPGNVRELKHVIEYAMNMADDNEEIKVADLPHHLLATPSLAGSIEQIPIPPLREALAHRERELISKALSASDGNIQKAAQLLKIPRQTLQYKLKINAH